MKVTMKYILGWITALMLLVQVSHAGNYAYVYIEGDKQTPFYVKMEGQMMPRLGKNYCIIPNLAAGVTYLEVLFQQNAYPAQKFAINIPEGGSRGFVLQKVNDRQFALYDMQQGNYIVSGNKPEDDRLPEAGTPAPVVTSTEPVATTTTATETDELPTFRQEKKAAKTKKPVKEKTVKETPKSDDRFIGNMELNTDGSQAATAEPLPDFNTPKPVPAPVKAKKKTKAKPKTESDANLAAINDEEERTDNKPVVKAQEESNPTDTGVPNSDCKTPMSSEDFENFALKILDKTDDDARIKVLSRGKGKQCFTTEQVRIIANNLDTQSGRYDVVKMLYSQTSDQSNYPQLESLFKTNYLRNKFKEIINPK